MTCKGICIRHKAVKPTGIGRYSSGQKRCQICEIFLIWNGLWCPCCSYRLRTRPRNVRFKTQLRVFKTQLRVFKEINKAELPELNEQPSKTHSKAYIA